MPGCCTFADILGEEHTIIEAQSRSLTPHQIRMIPSVLTEQIAESFRPYPLPITSMGRGLWQDPAYFQGVCAAVDYAIQLHNQSK